MMCSTCVMDFKTRLSVTDDQLQSVPGLSLYDNYYKDFKVECQHCKAICSIGENLEGLADHSMNHCHFKCKFDNCTQVLSVDQLINHFDDCEFQPIACPLKAFCDNKIV